MEQAEQRICLWFYTQGEEAARFYVSLLPDSRVERVLRDPDGTTVNVVEFRLGGTGYIAINGGPHLRLTEAVPISVMTADQAETDRLWAALTANGGEGGRCGWLRDRFGLSWQVLPEALPRLMARADRDAAGRVAQSLMEMGRIDIARLEAAFHDASWSAPT
ncbi:VOC family protein [Limimaricola sp.]|uniref:VOC family protein n=1 Tax=Limimaricola sp. TaxID=2211665 RepID=UPI0040595EC6